MKDGTYMSSAMNNDRPIPMGAMKVARCFSAANMKIVKTSCIVKNISMNRPCTTVVGFARVVATLNPPGWRPYTTPEAAIAPSICAMMIRMPRT